MYMYVHCTWAVNVRNKILCAYVHARTAALCNSILRCNLCYTLQYILCYVTLTFYLALLHALQHSGRKMSFSEFVVNLERIGVKLPKDLIKVRIKKKETHKKR